MTPRVKMKKLNNKLKITKMKEGVKRKLKLNNLINSLCKWMKKRNKIQIRNKIRINKRKENKRKGNNKLMNSNKNKINSRYNLCKINLLDSHNKINWLIIMKS